MTSQRNLIGFLILCLIWGSTWIGISAGVRTVPPVIFAGTRFAAAGVLLLAIATFRHGFIVPAPGERLRLLAASVLSITLCYAPLFWGMKYVASGTAAVLEMSLTPLALLGFAICLREESWNRTRGVAIAVGTVGLAILFLPDASLDPDQSSDNAMKVLGAAAVAWAAISSAWGSILSRALLSQHHPILIAGWTTLVGGLLLITTSIAFEPGGAAALTRGWEKEAMAGWIFLVIFGSVVGYTIYMRLIRDIGSRTGNFAFVSPVIAIMIGIGFNGEIIGVLDLFGMTLMLGAAYLSLRSQAADRSIEGKNRQEFECTGDPYGAGYRPPS
ncbi:EamA family transporter [Ensifer adhaerens]